MFDGSRLIKSFDNLTLAGRHDKALDAANTFKVTTPVDVLFGLSVSVAMFFAAAPSEEKRTASFTAVGADFE